MKNNKAKDEIIEKILRWRPVPMLAGILTAVVIFSGSLLISFFERERSLNDERFHTTRHLSVIRAQLEGLLNARILLVKGIVSYVSLYPHITSRDFQAYAKELIGKDRLIRNVSLIKNTTIFDVYPLKGNEKAIGIDIAAIPEQRATIQRAIDAKKIVIQSPVKLVQGGVATICRIPIFVSAPDRKFSKSRYWGQASMVINQISLLKEAGLFDESLNLRYALYHKNDKGKRGSMIWGDETITRSEPVLLDVVFPGGIWQLAAVPAEGWGYSDTRSFRYAVEGFFLALVLGFLIYTVINATRKIYTLESILPICANCKKIRDDRGYWEQVDSYLDSVSNIKFSHGLCPDCAEKLYGHEEWYKKKSGK